MSHARLTTSSRPEREPLPRGVEGREASLRGAEPVSELKLERGDLGAEQEQLVLDVAIPLAAVLVRLVDGNGSTTVRARRVLGLWIPGKHVG